MFFSFFDKIPLTGAKVIIALIMAVIAVWVMFLPKKYIVKGLEKPKGWQNLKIWVLVLMVVQIIVYLSF